MAIKKDVQPGDVIAFRKVYGSGLHMYYNHLESKDVPKTYHRPCGTTFKELNDSTASPYCVVRLKLKTRRARSKGIAVTSEMLPILKALDIKTIPLADDVYGTSRSFVEEYIRDYGFFSLSYKKTSSRQFRYYRDGRFSELTDGISEHIVPSIHEHDFYNYYIAVGVEADILSSKDDYEEAFISESVSKYTDKIGNFQYSSLLEKDILEVEA